MKQKSFNGDVIYASVLQKMIIKERANQNASLERLSSVLFCLVSLFMNFPRDDGTSQPQRRLFYLRSSSLYGTQPLSCPEPTTRIEQKKKHVDVPPDMGLEPMTLRLKV